MICLCNELLHIQPMSYVCNGNKQLLPEQICLSVIFWGQSGSRETRLSPKNCSPLHFQGPSCAGCKERGLLPEDSSSTLRVKRTISRLGDGGVWRLNSHNLVSGRAERVGVSLSKGWFPKGGFYFVKETGGILFREHCFGRGNSRSSALNSVSSAKNSVSSLWHTNNSRLR